MAQMTQAIYDFLLQEHIDYVPGADVPAGTIVFFGPAGTNKLVGIALVPLLANRRGALCISGGFKIRKKAGVAFAYGDRVGWDAAGVNAGGTGEAVLDNDANLDNQLGICVFPAAAGDDFAMTKINATLVRAAT